MIATSRPRVNRLYAVLTGLLLSGCHLGRPPPPPAGLSVGAVSAPVVEPGLPEQLRQGLALALQRRGGLGSGAAVDMVVLDASDGAAAVDGAGSRVHRVRLQVAFEVTGAAPRRLVLDGERSYVADATGSLVTATRRADAFALLSRELAQRAAAWALAAPAPERP